MKVITSTLLVLLLAARRRAYRVHSHLIGEQPSLYYIHFWADGSPTDVLRGLRAALDAAR